MIASHTELLARLREYKPGFEYKSGLIVLIILFYFIYYRQYLPQAALPVFRLLTGRFLRFFAPQGRLVAPIKVKFGREERTIAPLLRAKFDLDWFRVGGSRPPKLKKIEFYQYNCPKGACPLHDFYKIYKFYARPQST